VDINSLVGLAPLLGDAIIGKNIGTVELVEADQADQNVFDIKLTNASLDKFNNVGGANGIETGLAFAFQKVSLTDHGQTSEGGLGPAETTNATAQRFAAGAALDTVTPSVPSENTVHYFLKVQGVTGNSTAAKHQGWFEVDGFDFGVTRPVSAGSSGGAAGRVTFSPLTVDINSLVGLAPLLRDAIIGKNIGTVELVEADQADQNVYDIKLTNASLDKFSNSGGANGIETGLTFGFQKVSLTDHGQTSEGGLGPAETTNATAQRFAAGTALDTVTQAQNPLHYFLKVEGVTGGSIDDKHAGWFEVDKFDFGVTRPVSIGSSGASAGRVTSSPLTLDINSIVGQAPLLADLASGHALKTVELVGVTQSDQTVYDLKLTNAILSMVQSAAGFPGVETSLAFNFQQGTLIDHGVTTEGALSSPETVNFSSRSAVA
jgi:type VI protein secretion system component Hcp